MATSHGATLYATLADEVSRVVNYYDEIVWLEHSRDIPRDLSPYDKRDGKLDCHLDRVGIDAAVGMPIHVAHFFEAKAIEVFEHVHTWPHHQVIRIEHFTHSVAVVIPLR